mmetsp:Transcript_14317/g.30596  ORF Transcript_14317/g.30596 Transcript_14317/m.30596 type:complete len:134 (-) Transcript_14317:781-1182(-)
MPFFSFHDFGQDIPTWRLMYNTNIKKTTQKIRTQYSSPQKLASERRQKQSESDNLIFRLIMSGYHRKILRCFPHLLLSLFRIRPPFTSTRTKCKQQYPNKHNNHKYHGIDHHIRRGVRLWVICPILGTRSTSH